MRTLGTERFYTAHGEGTWAGGRREGVTASVAEGVVLGGGTDVLLRYFEEMELADEVGRPPRPLLLDVARC